MIQFNKFVLAGTALAALCVAGQVKAENLITNGDFATGNLSGFTTGYDNETGVGGDSLQSGGDDMGGAGTLGVGKDPNFYHVAFGIPANSPSNAEMLTVNGSINQSEVVLSQTLAAPLSAGSYEFSVLGASAIASLIPPDTNAAVLTVEINNGSQSLIITLPALGDHDFHQFSGIVTFTSAPSGPSTITITDSILLGNGNDFVLTDLSLHAVPEPTSFALMGLGGLGMAFRAIRRRGRVAAV